MKRIVNATIRRAANSYTYVLVDGETVERPLDPWHKRVTNDGQRVSVSIWPNEHMAYLVTEAG